MTRIPYRDLPDAGLWRRLAAACYDGLLLFAIWFVLGFLVAIVETAIQPPDMSGAIRPLVPAAIAPWVVLPVLWLVAVAFYALFWRRGGQTLGMQTWRLRLVCVDGGTPGARAIIVRAVVGTLSLLLGGAGFLWVLVGGRTWHDLASRTRVVVLPKDAV